MSNENCIYSTHMIKYNNGGILERKKNTLLSEAKQKNKWRSQPEMAWGKTSGQRWLYFSSSTGSPIRRFLSWICKRASFGYGKENWEIFNSDRSCTSYKQKQTRQQNRKPCASWLCFRTSKSRMERRGI